MLPCRLHLALPLAGYRCERLRRTPHFRAHCRGGFYCLEATCVAKRHCFHPHIHALLDLTDPRGLTASWLSRRWKKLSRGAYVVDLRPLTRMDVPDRLWYLLKPLPLVDDTAVVSEFYGSLPRQRRFQAFGVIRRDAPKTNLVPPGN